MHRKILLIERDQDVRDIITFVLEAEGYSVHYLAEPAMLWQLKGYRPDLVVVDEWRYGQDGLRFCQRFKNDTLLQNVPILLISTSEAIEELADACNAGGYIRMPFNLNDLLKQVRLST